VKTHPASATSRTSATSLDGYASTDRRYVREERGDTRSASPFVRSSVSMPQRTGPSERVGLGPMAWGTRPRLRPVRRSVGPRGIRCRYGDLASRHHGPDDRFGPSPSRTAGERTFGLARA
jgi:hypothetical protein